MGFNILRLKALMKEKKITQKVLSENIDVTTQTVINYFNGRSKIDIYTLEKVCNFLNVDISYFFDDSPNNIVNEPLPTYEVKPLFLEQRMEEVEKEIKQIKNKLKL